MKKTCALLLVSLFAAFAFAQEAAKKTSPATAPTANKEAAGTIELPAAAAVVSAPFVLKDGVISQPAQTEVSAGGKAIFTFKIAQAGDYVIHAVVSAADEDSNSFFLNVDAMPEDPLMIWDNEVTQGFDTRVVGWRGSGDAAAPEFAPKIFKLSAGEHKLYVVGREPGGLKSLSIRPAKK